MKGVKHIFTKRKGEMIPNHKFLQYLKYGSILTIVHLIILRSLQEIHPWKMLLKNITLMS
jgi:hypothetical protein